jgi:hypothetical protein
LHLLIEFPLFVDLERNPSFIALSLLKAIVNRKLVVPQMYDLAIRVAELMVTSQVESIRKKCSQILLKFLLHYRLSKKNLQQHLDFLLNNLRHVSLRFKFYLVFYIYLFICIYLYFSKNDVAIIAAMSIQLEEKLHLKCFMQ